MTELMLNFYNTFALLQKNAKIFLQKTNEKLRISGRWYHKILRVARTIADMEEAKISLLTIWLRLYNTDERYEIILLTYKRTVYRIGEFVIAFLFL